MPKSFKPITDRPRDRKKINALRNTKVRTVDESKPSFLEFNQDGQLNINYFDKKLNEYVAVETTFYFDSLSSLEQKQLDEVAFALLQGQEEKLLEEYALNSVAVPIVKTCEIKGTSSVKSLSVGIYASATQDEIALHYLLNRTRGRI